MVVLVGVALHGKPSQSDKIYVARLFCGSFSFVVINVQYLLSPKFTKSTTNICLLCFGWHILTIHFSSSTSNHHPHKCLALKYARNSLNIQILRIQMRNRKLIWCRPNRRYARYIFGPNNTDWVFLEKRFSYDDKRSRRPCRT